jgi:hypothetical protein
VSKNQLSQLHPALRSLRSYVEGRPARRLAIERHVRGCSDCARKVELLCTVVHERAEIQRDARVGAVVEQFEAVFARIARTRKAAAASVRRQRRRA